MGIKKLIERFGHAIMAIVSPQANMKIFRAIGGCVIGIWNWNCLKCGESGFFEKDEDWEPTCPKCGEPKATAEQYGKWRKVKAKSGEQTP